MAPGPSRRAPVANGRSRPRAVEAVRPRPEHVPRHPGTTSRHRRRPTSSSTAGAVPSASASPARNSRGATAPVPGSGASTKTTPCTRSLSASTTAGTNSPALLCGASTTGPSPADRTIASTPAGQYGSALVATPCRVGTATLCPRRSSAWPWTPTSPGRAMGSGSARCSGSRSSGFQMSCVASIVFAQSVAIVVSAASGPVSARTTATSNRRSGQISTESAV